MNYGILLVARGEGENRMNYGILLVARATL